MPDTDGKTLLAWQIEHILKKQDLFEAKFDRLREDDLAQMKTDLALLKLQAAMWGALAGTVLSTIAAVFFRFVFRL